MWKARGDEGLAQLVDNAMEVSQYLKDKISNRPGFEVINNAKELTNVCFHYIPTSMRNKERTEEWWDLISKVFDTNINYLPVLNLVHEIF